MTTSDWRELAPWYAEKQGEEGDFWHRTLLDPPLFALLGGVAGQHVLDLACGNGHNTRRLARMGARVTGVEYAEAHIEANREREAREPLGIAYHLADAARLDALADASFDVVVCQMALMDISDAAGALREVGRVLRPGGRLVAQIAHPCFDVPEASAWVVERMGPETAVWRKVRRYRQPFVGRIYWRVGDEVVSTASYHRPLSWYVRELRAAGLVLTALEEPEPSEEFLAGAPDHAWMREVPLHVLFEARKVEV